IHVNDIKQYNNLKKKIEEQQIEFHTYTIKENKTHAFVLRGLDHQPKIEEIQNELINQKVEVKQIFQMKQTRRPAYLVITSKNETIDTLSNKVTVIDYIKISWERHFTSRRITQCHRCQQWGHATSNCNVKEACLKCAGEHLTKNCTKSRDTPAKCINCGGEHPANYTGCPAYLERLEFVEKKQEENTKNREKPKSARTFQPAP
ncbi:hypothetical protein BDFB_011737, partial [Asbolus verrucosus]